MSQQDRTASPQNGTAHPIRRRIGLAALAILAVIGIGYVGYVNLWLPSRPLDVSHLRIDFTNAATTDATSGTTAGSPLTKARLNDGVSAIVNHYQDLHGCAIDRIAYDGRRSHAELQSEQRMAAKSPDSASTVASAISEYGIGHVADFQMDFTCHVPASGFGKGTTQGYNVWLAYAPTNPNADHGWVFIDSGY
ncbi:hypothetical protein [Bifidobacterium simiarum]|uniref:hypothetical protein n=1 Tax=Bifidobacterium simiarum TaxID=2045441 RepID=UPI001BDC1F84|nr:hypothetical protein [Bifidobacterium simiarum]MBT1166415.1 hypothetical protein [Bifidobacterium simiarum]